MVILRGSNQTKKTKKKKVIKFCKISIEILTLGLFEPFYKKEKNHYFNNSNTTVKSWKIKPQELSLGHYFTHCLHRLRCVTLNIINTFFHFCLSLSLKVNLAPFQSSVFQVVSLGFCQICWISHLEPFVEFCLVWDWKSAEKEEMWGDFLNLLHPSISMHILHTVLHTFPRGSQREFV